MSVRLGAASTQSENGCDPAPRKLKGSQETAGPSTGNFTHVRGKCYPSVVPSCAPVAQLDRAIASGAIGREFESLRARHSFSHYCSPDVRGNPGVIFNAFS